MQGYDEYELIPNYFGEKIDWENLFKKKRELINLQKSNESADFCKNCIYLEERNWQDDDSINCMIFNHWTNCNSACIYCYFGQNHNYYNNQKYYDIVPVLEDMEANGIIKAIDSSFISFGGGEPTILKGFDKILKIVIRNGFKKIRVNTSGILYSEAIAKGLENKNLNICISPDSGSRNKYKQIKQVDCFDLVWANINKYIKSSTDKNDVKVKYIILPNINDSKKDINEFFETAEKNNVSSVCLSVDKMWTDTLTEENKNNQKELEIYDLMNYFEQKSNSLGYQLELYSEGLSFKEFINSKYKIK